MLALVYLGLAIALGDFICRRFYRFVSVPRRWAAATLVGILLSAWFTYLAGMVFARTAEPLLSADLLFFVAAAVAIFWFSKKSPETQMIEPRAPGRALWDWVTTHDGGPDRAVLIGHGLPRAIRLGILSVLLAATVAQAVDFQIMFWRKGPERYVAFNALYKAAYDAAVARPERPIYLENGQWGPTYMDAYWYATVEGRPLSQFVRLADGAKPPSGAIVLSSNSDCRGCEVIKKCGEFELYRAK
jgi:hypothetical protein